ncbi:MAG: EAL domain-containing protein [Alphaproteobacteria bacterium]|nr:EAL domain-containing protein [Alphaproteobacteria bacterium]
MSSFITFIKNIEQDEELHIDEFSVMQIQIKNFEQIAIIYNVVEFKAIGSLILNSLNDILKKDLLKIYEYDKYYYCLLRETDGNKLHLLGKRLRDELSREIDPELFFDVKISSIVVSSSCSIFNALMILSIDEKYLPQRSFFYFFDAASVLFRMREEYLLLGEIKNAIDSETACFAFQPVVICKTGEVSYHECLLRLNNHECKLVSAGRYIMLAEKYGYITHIDKYVFEMAVKELQQSSDVKLSVNISSIAIQDKMIADHILGIIRESDVGGRMIIEITETAFNDNFAVTKYFVDTAKSMGCLIALDDFGVGYTSFNHVRDYEIDIIKIDGCFIRGLDENQKNRSLVETLIKTSEELGCKTVAEFVENGSVAKQLIDLNVDYMQGNFFSPAINYRSWNKHHGNIIKN